MPFKLSLAPRVSPICPPPNSASCYVASLAEPTCKLQPSPPATPFSENVYSCSFPCSPQLLCEYQASGPVTALSSFNGLMYCCNSKNAHAFTGQHLGALPSFDSPMMSQASAIAVVDSSLVVTAHKDFKIRLWSPSASTIACQLHQVAILPSLRQCFQNWTMQHRYVQTRRHGKKYPWMQHSDTISALAISPDRTLLYSASWDRTVKVWSLKEGHGSVRCEESFTAHIDSINTMLVGGKDALLYTGSADKSIKVWVRRRAKGTGLGGGRRSVKFKHSMVEALEGQRAAVNALVISSDGSLMYSGGSDGRVLVWRRSRPSLPSEEKKAEAGKLFKVQESLRGHARAVLCLNLLSVKDGADFSALVFSGSADNTIRVWRQQHMREVSSGYLHHECIAVMKAHTAAVRSLWIGEAPEEQCGSTRSPVIFSGCLDGHIKMWKLVPASSSSSVQSSSASAAAPTSYTFLQQSTAAVNT